MKRILILLAALLAVGFSKSLFQLGTEAYNKGDYHKAAKLFEKACDYGEPKGCAILGALYKDGQIVKQDYHKAAELYQKACDDGEPKGCAILGTLYEDGQIVKQDFNKAKQYFGKACDLGLQIGCDLYRTLNEYVIK